MAIYISMLRGINVGKHKRISMAELIALYESLGFKNVRTYVQSGNVIFTAPEKNDREFARMIEEKIHLVLEFPLAVILRTPDELEQTILHNPFLKESGLVAEKLFITFFSAVPEPAALNNITENRNESDRFMIGGKQAYLYCPDGYGQTKFSNNFFEKKLGVIATTRNWKTVVTLLEMTKKPSF